MAGRRGAGALTAAVEAVGQEAQPQFVQHRRELAFACLPVRRSNTRRSRTRAAASPWRGRTPSSSVEPGRNSPTAGHRRVWNVAHALSVPAGACRCPSGACPDGPASRMHAKNPLPAVPCQDSVRPPRTPCLWRSPSRHSCTMLECRLPPASQTAPVEATRHAAAGAWPDVAKSGTFGVESLCSSACGVQASLHRAARHAPAWSAPVLLWDCPCGWPQKSCPD